MNSKEDILKSHVKDIYLFNHGTLEKREQFQAAVHLAMDEYSKQQAIAFGRFITNNEFEYNEADPEGWQSSFLKKRNLTDDDLYDLFLQDQSKQQ